MEAGYKIEKLSQLPQILLEWDLEYIEKNDIPLESSGPGMIYPCFLVSEFQNAWAFKSTTVRKPGLLLYVKNE